MWPVPEPHLIAHPFVAPPHRYAAGHRGIDISAAAGTTVVAPADGVVHFVGVVVNRPVLSIRHATGVISSFEPVTSVLVTGQVVTRGSPIGVLMVGHRPDPCLHVGVRVHGEYISPLRFLGAIRASVLLPTRRL